MNIVNLQLLRPVSPPAGCPKAVLFVVPPWRYKAAMLTALVHAASTPGALAVTLSSLVPAVAEGLVSHAVVILPAANPDAERIADAMGASVIVATSRHWQAAAITARGEWLLLLDAGEVPGQGWIGAVERHLIQQSSARQMSACLPLAGVMAGLGERVAQWSGARRLRAGLIAPRRQAVEGSIQTSPARLQVTRQKTVA